MLVSLQFMLTVTLYKIVDHARLLLKLTVSACILESQTLLSLFLPLTRSACAENEACQTIKWVNTTGIYFGYKIMLSSFIWFICHHKKKQAMNLLYILLA